MRLRRLAPTRTARARPRRPAPTSCSSSRAAARCAPRTRRSSARAARSSPSRTPTRCGSPTRCARSSRRSPTRGVGYVCGQVRFVDRRRHQPGGRLLALRDGAARRCESRLASVTGGQRRDLRDAPRRPTSTSTRSWATTSRSRSTWSSAAGARVVRAGGARDGEDGARRSRASSRRKRRMMSHAWPIVLRGGLLVPRGYAPLYALMIYSHRLLRYVDAVPARRSRSPPNAALLGAGARLRVALARRSRCWPPRRWPRAAARRCCSPATTCSPPRRSPPGLCDWLRHGTRGGLGRRRRARGEREPLRGPRRRSVGGAIGCCVARAVAGASLVAMRRRSGSSRRGHPIYRQRRVGQGRRAVRLLKLRTMVAGAEHMGAGLAVNEGDTAHHARRRAPAPLLDRRAAEPRQRPARRDVDRSARGRRVPVQVDAVHRAPARPPGGQARASPAGRRSTAARRCRGPSASSSTSGTSSTARCGSTCGSCGGPRGCSSRATASTRARRAAGADADRDHERGVLLTGVGQALRHRQRVRRSTRRVVAADPNPLAPAQYAADVRVAPPRDRRPRLRAGPGASCASAHDVGAVVPLTDLDIEVLAHARADGPLPALVPDPEIAARHLRQVRGAPAARAPRPALAADRAARASRAARLPGDGQAAPAARARARSIPARRRARGGRSSSATSTSR